MTLKRTSQPIRLSKFTTDLKTFNKTTPEQNLLALLTDLTNHAESIWDNFGIRYETVMNQKEWDTYIHHPERTPYTTKIKSLQNKRYKAVFDYTIELLKEVYPYYKKLTTSEYKNDLKKAINSILECSINARFNEEDMRERDEYLGRSKTDRDEGKVELTPFQLNRYNFAIKQYCKLNGKTPEELTKQIMEACQGNLLKMEEYLSTCDVPLELRKDLKGVSEIVSNDLNLSFLDIQRGWNIWKLMREIGIDTDEYLNLLGLTKFSTLKTRLLSFMNNKSFCQEFVDHLKDELPETYKVYKKTGQIDVLHMNFENAQRKEYPKSLRQDQEIQQVIAQTQEEIYKYFPLAQTSSPRSNIFNPVNPAATSRAFNSSIKNKDGKLVNAVVMTPRTSSPEYYVPTFAHETTHALHRKILELGELARVLKVGASESVSTAVMEEFSQLVDMQFKAEKSLPYSKKYSGAEFPNFMAALTTRFQVPFSLVQLSMRKEFDQLIDSGYTDNLTNSQIFELKVKYDKLVKEWLSTGVKVNHPTLRGFGLFDSTSPRDGTVYMKRYIMHDQEEKAPKLTTKTNKQVEQLKMADAFKKRWGEKWIEQKEARIFLHWLLLETGRNEKTELYGQIIVNKPVAECLYELKKLGLKEEKIA